jgi:hypothetical protein
MMLSKHRLDLGVLGELECDVESAATIVRKPTEDNYDSVDILRVTVPLGPVRADVTKLLSDEAIEEIREKNRRRLRRLPTHPTSLRNRMSTWHQETNPTPLWHPTKWTVVEDGLNRLQSVSRWDSAQEAAAHAEKVKGYILQPYSEESK